MKNFTDKPAPGGYDGVKRLPFTVTIAEVKPVAIRDEVEAKILEVLKETPEELHTEEIAARLGLARHTVSKYLQVLLARGTVSCRKVGNAKLWNEVSSQVRVRPLRESDLPELLRIEERIERSAQGYPADGGDSDSDSQDKGRLEALEQAVRHSLAQGTPHLNLAAELQGRLVGFILGEVRTWEFGRAGATGWIKVLGVDPQFQSHGIGRLLGQRLLEHFRASGARQVRTLVDWHAGELLTYFKSLGFTLLPMLPLERELSEEKSNKERRSL